MSDRVFSKMQNIIIFGATGAIGRATSHQLAADGASLTLAGRDEASLSALAAEIGGQIAICDAMDEASVTAVIAQAASNGPITGLVWAIGSILLRPLAKLSASDFADCYYLNTVAPALAVRDALPSLKEGQGSVLLFSSVAATQGFTAHAAIASAKAGVEGLVRSLAAECAPDIRVNAIAPSLTHSKMAQPIVANEAMAKGIAQTHPLRRLGEGTDFAPLASLLLDNTRSGWITGAIYPVDGGRQSLRTKG